MTKAEHTLDGFDMAPAILEREWVITIDTPVGGVEAVVTALGNELPLTQGPYDNCLFVRKESAGESLGSFCRVL